MAAGELKYGKGSFFICEVDLVNKIKVNHTARMFLKKLVDGK